MPGKRKKKARAAKVADKPDSPGSSGEPEIPLESDGEALSNNLKYNDVLLFDITKEHTVLYSSYGRVADKLFHVVMIVIFRIR